MGRAFSSAATQRRDVSVPFNHYLGGGAIF